MVRLATLTAAQAEDLLPEGRVHCTSPPPFMIGCDWGREDVVACIRGSQGVYLDDTGMAAGSGHPLMVHRPDGRWRWFEVDAARAKAA